MMSKYHANFSSSLLQATNVMFKTYTGEQLKPEGVLGVTIEHNGQQTASTEAVHRQQGRTTTLRA